MRSFTHLYMATVREFTRDFSALFWTLAFPVMFIIIFGIIFSGDDSIDFTIGLVNEDGDASADLVERFEQIDAFTIETGDRDDELNELEDGERDVVIVIPEGTGALLDEYNLALRNMQGGEQASAAPVGQPVREGESPLPEVPLDVYYDPADTTTSQVVLGLVDQVIGGMNVSMTQITPALTMDTRSVTADELSSIDYLLPGVLAMSLMQLGLFGTAATLVSLREKGVLRRMGATPLPKSTLLASQVAFRLTIALVQTATIVVLGWMLFDVQIETANLLQITGVVLLGAAVFITFGYFLSGLAKTEEAVQGIISLPNFLFMFLSGIFFPVSVMPDWIRPVVDVIPLTYLGDALRATMIEAGTYYSMPRNLLILGGWLVVCSVLAVRLFKWESQG
ncbi:MAG: ABC transporter permease [Chloroflexi bacterium]|nr:ABC transporter permease [Chloroflexota bacterium]